MKSSSDPQKALTNTKFMYFYEKYMNIIGPVGNLMFYIQAYKIFTTKTAASVSLEAFLISVVGLTSWLFYGILINNKPLIIANGFGVIGAILVIIGTMIY